MRFDPRNLGAKCEQCPIYKKEQGNIKPVKPSWVKNRQCPQAVIIAEAPGRTEEITGVPLSGMSGQFLESILEKSSNMLEHDAPMPVLSKLHKTNSCLCRTKQKLKESEWTEAVNACRPRLARELEILKSRGWNGKAIILGSKALQSITGEKSIQSWMGGPKKGVSFDKDGKRTEAQEVSTCFKDVEILPTIHPALCLRKPFWISVFTIHLLRGWQFVTDTLPKWEWGPIYVEPNEEQLKALESFDINKPLAMDTETSGPQHPLTGLHKKTYKGPLKLLDIGFSDGKKHVCVQWWYVEQQAKKGSKLCQAIKDRALYLIRNSNRPIWQNELYDRVVWYSLFKESLPPSEMDTLVAFKVIAPLLPGKLAMQACIYTHAERYKDLFKTGAGDDPSDAYAKADPVMRAIYCAKDCASTFIAYEENKKQLDMQNAWPIYESKMRLMQDALEMQIKGTCVDTSTFWKHRKRLRESMGKYRSAQVRLVRRLREKLQDDSKLTIIKQVKVGGNKKKSVGTAIFKKWNPQSKDHIAKYFEAAGHTPTVFTETGQASYNATVLESLCQHNNKDISEMARYILLYRKDQKVLSTYVDSLPTVNYSNILATPDKLKPITITKVHPSWQPWVAKSGRWGCRNPNRMNEPPSIRNMFIGDYYCEYEELNLSI